MISHAGWNEARLDMCQKSNRYDNGYGASARGVFTDGYKRRVGEGTERVFKFGVTSSCHGVAQRDDPHDGKSPLLQRTHFRIPTG